MADILIETVVLALREIEKRLEHPAVLAGQRVKDTYDRACAEIIIARLGTLLDMRGAMEAGRRQERERLANMTAEQALSFFAHNEALMRLWGEKRQ